MNIYHSFLTGIIKDARVRIRVGGNILPHLTSPVKLTTAAKSPGKFNTGASHTGNFNPVEQATTTTHVDPAVTPHTVTFNPIEQTSAKQAPVLPSLQVNTPMERIRQAANAGDIKIIGQQEALKQILRNRSKYGLESLELPKGVNSVYELSPKQLNTLMGTVGKKVNINYGGPTTGKVNVLGKNGELLPGNYEAIRSHLGRNGYDFVATDANGKAITNIDLPDLTGLRAPGTVLTPQNLEQIMQGTQQARMLRDSGLSALASVNGKQLDAAALDKYIGSGAPTSVQQFSRNGSLVGNYQDQLIQAAQNPSAQFRVQGFSPLNWFGRNKTTRGSQVLTGRELLEQYPALLERSNNLRNAKRKAMIGAGTAALGIPASIYGYNKLDEAMQPQNPKPAKTPASGNPKPAAPKAQQSQSNTVNIVDAAKNMKPGSQEPSVIDGSENGGRAGETWKYNP